MKKIVVLFILVFVYGLLSSILFANMITPQLTEKMNDSSDNEFIKVNIFLEETYPPQKLISESSGLAKLDKRQYVTSTLKEFSVTSQSDLICFLNEMKTASEVKNIKQLWIVNVVNCEMTKNAIEILTTREDIRSIDYDEKRNILLTPTVNKNVSKYLHEQRDCREITWNVLKVNADDVWSQGYDGSGVIVAVLDTGVNYNHVDLNDHLWSHPDYPNHGYDFVNNDDNPMDDHGHGTHCAGTVAGDGTAGSQTGMAPEASVMCVKLLDSSGGGLESACWSGVEFAVDNGADVLSMSFGWQHSWGTDRASWRNAMDYVYAAEVFASVAAGNEGAQQFSYPIPDNVRTPGDCPPPWLHPDQTLSGGFSSVVCIGATDYNDNLAGFSSRGPVTWEAIAPYNDYTYSPEMGLIRPDISAPGDNIKSLAYYSNTGYEDGWSGTSMATPAVAGIIALMLSKDYSLTPTQIDQIIEENVEVAQNPKNNNYGSGRIDALNSINAITEPNTPPNEPVNPTPGNEQENVSITTNLSWMNGGGATSYQVFFGTNNPPSNLVNGDAVDESYFEIAEALDFETEYYWCINAINDFGSVVGPIWSFTTAAPADEDFETGDFSLFPWDFAGNLDWTVQSNEVYEGSYSAKSGSITHSQTSELLLTFDVEEDDQISFYAKISCEEDQNDNWDYLAFYIDNIEQERWDGEVNWGYHSYNVSSGNHIFKWKYLKDGSVSSGSDCAWIDYITFPAEAPQPPELVIEPQELIFEAFINETITSEITIENIGESTGIYSIELDYTDDWMDLDIFSGEVEQGEIDTISVIIDPDGLENGEYSGNINISDNRNTTIIPVTLTVNMVGTDTEIVQVNQLLGNHPNPFNPTTMISFTTVESGIVEISIYSIKGQKIITLNNDNLEPGLHSVIWNARDRSDDPVSSGVYFYTLKLNGKTEATKKMLLLK
ncbi:MAG: S8 family serine peptidase [Candidatus Cloacimonetes bacterium]|nr:S8 family serine peptidase [Candidatus Cloacimonadota bacterium]